MLNRRLIFYITQPALFPGLHYLPDDVLAEYVLHSGVTISFRSLILRVVSQLAAQEMKRKFFVILPVENFLLKFQLMVTEAEAFSQMSAKLIKVSNFKQRTFLILTLRSTHLIVSFHLDTHSPSPQHKDSSNNRLTHSHKAHLLHLLSHSSHLLQPLQWPHS